MNTTMKHGMKTQWTAVAMAAALALPGVALAQQKTNKPAEATAQSSQGAQQPVALLASDLIGKQVTNAKGQDLGEVQDLAVDMRNGRVHYAMLDMQNKMFAYPMRTLQLTPDGDKVMLNVAEDRLERAPGMERQNRAAERNGRVGNEYNAYWNEADRFWRDGEPGRAGSEQRGATGPQVSVKPRQDMQLVWASKLLGWNLHGRANDDSIGEVKDLVINPRDGRVQFAAVDFNDKVGGRDAAAIGDKLHPLPLSALSLRDGRDDLAMQTDPARLQAAQGFDESRLEERLTDRSFIDKAQRYAQGLGKAAAGS